MAYDQDLADRLREVLSSEERLAEQKMFGGLAFLVAGHLAVAASGQGGLLVRTDPGRSGALLARRHAEPMVMGGRSMAGWLRVAPEGVRSTRDLRRWVGEALAYVHGLPPKNASRTRR